MLTTKAIEKYMGFAFMEKFCTVPTVGRVYEKDPLSRDEFFVYQNVCVVHKISVIVNTIHNLGINHIISNTK